MTTYTITTDSGVIERGLTAQQAADMILSADGYRWELRQESPESLGTKGWGLYRSRFSENSTFGAREMHYCYGYYVICDTHDDAWTEIARRVVERGAFGWRGFHGDVTPDAEYERLIADDEVNQ